MGAVLATGAIQRMLQQAYTDTQPMLARGDWRREFSGKELLHHVRDWIYRVMPGQGTGVTRDSDIAKAVAGWQVNNNAVPPEVTALRAALRGRVGLP
jgi:hypothetical protein